MLQINDYDDDDDVYLSIVCGWALATRISYANSAQAIEMPFGSWLGQDDKIGSYISQPVGRGPKVGRDRDPECDGPRWSIKAVQKSQTVL